jgi:sec-independent protein translocase protein TatC
MPAEMTVLEHLHELRNRIFLSLLAITVASMVCYIFYTQLFTLLYHPFKGLEKMYGTTLYITSIFEGFTVKVKLSVIAGIVLSVPVHLYNLIAYIFPALLARERKIVGWGLAASFVLVLFSFYYGYSFLIPVGVSFLSRQNFVPQKVGMLLSYAKNMNYIWQLLLLTMMMFQLPILLEVLMIVKVLKRRSVLKATRFIILIIFVLAAIVTPPDFVSQLLVAVPMTVLFFLTIVIAKLFKFGEG